ncbi:MAG: choice-of-anchor B family protein [Bacteroidota bacterium]
MVISLLFLAFSRPESLHAQQAKNMNLVGKLPYAGTLNDIWGYVSPQGVEYALVGLRDGFSIVSLADPTQPVEVHFIPGSITIWRDIKTYGHYAYVSNEGGNGTLIVDLSQLPGSVTFKDTVLNGINTAHNIYIDDGKLFQTGGNLVSGNAVGGVEIFDLATDPWNPAYLGTYSARYVHDIYVRNGLGYSAEINSGRLSILDLSDPTAPLVLGSKAYPEAFTHNSWLNDAGTVCYTTDEFAGAYIRAWDVSDPNNIDPLDKIKASLSDGKAIPHNVHVKNDFLITAYYRDGIQIVDGQYPYNLVEVGYYDTSPLSDGGFNGSWGAYPYLPSGLILASDMEEGLFVLSAQLQRACYLEGVVRDSVEATPLKGVHLEVLGSSEADQSKTSGFYAIGIADSGIYQVAFSKFGYKPDTLAVALFNDSIVTVDVNLSPLPVAPLEVIVLEAGSLLPISDAQVLVVAPNDAETLSYTTSSAGKVQEPAVLISEYEIRAGKWGYVTQRTSITMDSLLNQVQLVLEKGYYDDFSVDLGWQSSGTAIQGLWERGEPFGTYTFTFDTTFLSPDVDLPFDIGNEAYVTGNAGTLPNTLFFGDEVDEGSAILISPPMDLSGYQDPVIQFHWWFLNLDFSNQLTRPGNDFLSVLLTDGLDTVELHRYDTPLSNIWTLEEGISFIQDFDLDLRPLQLIFYTQDLEKDRAEVVEAALDGFEVIENPTTHLAEDLPQVAFYVDQASESLFYELAAGTAPQSWRVSLLSLTGQRLWEGHIDGLSGRLQLPSGLPHSLYLIGFEFEGKRSSWQKVILGR